MRLSTGDKKIQPRNEASTERRGCPIRDSIGRKYILKGKQINESGDEAGAGSRRFFLQFFLKRLRSCHTFSLISFEDF
jgi:hypothetical protein